MRTILLAWAAAMAVVQTVPGSSCLCPEELAAPKPEPDCCGESLPDPPEPCGCFHRAESDSATLDLTLVPATFLAAAEAPIDAAPPRFGIDAGPCQESWRADQARGSPLYLLHSVLLI